MNDVSDLPTANLDPNSTSSHDPSHAVTDTSRDSIQRGHHLQQGKKAQFLNHLIRSIDIMVYCQLSILYYME